MKNFFRTIQTPLLIIVMFMYTSACVGISGSNNFIGTAWVADREWLDLVIPSDGTMVSPRDLEGLSPTTEITLHFGQENLTGQDGCNRYRARYTLTGKRIAVSDFVLLTKFECYKWVYPRQQLFMNALAKSARIKGSSSSLELLDEDDLLLYKFVAINGDLAGTDWTVNLLENQPVLEGVYLSIDFGLDGRVRGSVGCNTFNSPYNEENGELHISEVGLTERGCTGPEGILEQEFKMADLLRKVAAYEIVGDVLLFKDINDLVIIESLRR